LAKSNGAGTSNPVIKQTAPDEWDSIIILTIDKK
jgi:hypothetical protein